MFQRCVETTLESCVFLAPCWGAYAYTIIASMYAMVYLPYIYQKNQPNVGNYTMHGWKEHGDVILFFFRPFQLSGIIFQRNVSMIPGSSKSVQLKSYVPRHPNTS